MRVKLTCSNWAGKMAVGPRQVYARIQVVWQPRMYSHIRFNGPNVPPKLASVTKREDLDVLISQLYDYQEPYTVTFRPGQACRAIIVCLEFSRVALTA